MPYFPMFTDLSGQRCIIAGGGQVALRKAEKLLPFRPDITVISPAFCSGFAALPVTRIPRPVTPEDIPGAFLVIAATSDRAVNAALYAQCSALRIPVNTVDDPALCTFFFPALAMEGDLVAGISTGGKSPVLARYLRKEISALLDDRLLGIAGLLAQLRPAVRQKYDTEAARKQAMDAALSRCLTAEELPALADLLEEFT